MKMKEWRELKAVQIFDNLSKSHASEYPYKAIEILREERHHMSTQNIDNTTPHNADYVKGTYQGREDGIYWSLWKLAEVMTADIEDTRLRSIIRSKLVYGRDYNEISESIDDDDEVDNLGYKITKQQVPEIPIQKDDESFIGIPNTEL